MFYLLLILSSYVLSLSIHGGNVRLVSLTQFVHPLNEIVSLLGQLSKLIVHEHFLLTGSHLLVSERFKLVIK